MIKLVCKTFSMIKNYIKTAWRNLLRSKSYSIVAVLGLAIGLAVSILLFWGVNDELVYDTQIKDAPDIYRLNARIKMGDNVFDTWTNVPAPEGAIAQKTFPSVKQMVRFSGRQVLVNANNQTFIEKQIAYTEPAFFDMFHVRVIEGNATSALGDKYNVALSNSLAIKYFGSAAKALGKTMIITEKQQPFIVSAVFEDMPLRSSVHKDMLLSLDYIRMNFGGNGNWKTIDEDWGNFGFTTFFRMRQGADIKSFVQRLSALHAKNNSFVKPGDVTFIMQPLNTLRLYNPDMTPAGIKMVHIFILVGILILLIAVINYINLSTARATKRAKEVGLRRVVGADRKQLILQFVIEFVLIFIGALVLAFLLMPTLVPLYRSISGKDYPIDYWTWSTARIILWVGFGTIVLASIYPAWVLSSFRPTEVIKATFNSPSKGGWLRKTLVVLQFTFSITLIICTAIITKQLYFIQHHNLGYNRENTFTVALNDKIGKHLSTVKNDLKAYPHIGDVAYASDNILEMSSSTDNISWPGKINSQAHISPMEVSANFTMMMGMKFVDGGGFTSTEADSAYYLVNEAAVQMMNLKHPVGTMISLWGRSRQIKGVLKDFNNGSMKELVKPAIFEIANANADYGLLYIKSRSAFVRESVDKAGALYHKYNPSHPFAYEFLDDDFDAMYRREIQTSALFKAFAGVTVLLSCMGLFGLAVFTAERRIKEIGIRKVLGASVKDISVLISGEFTGLIVIANIIAWPMAWYLTHQWLQDFAYRTNMSWWIFLLCGVLSLVLAVLTVSSQAVRAAMVNPVKSLKAE